MLANVIFLFFSPDLSSIQSAVYCETLAQKVGKNHTSVLCLGFRAQSLHGAGRVWGMK